MRLILTAIGRARSGPIKTLFDDYSDRVDKAGPLLGFRSFKLHEIAESRARTTSERISQEADFLLDAIGSDQTLVLDEHGENLRSADFADWLARLRDDGCPALNILIGGPDGLDDKIRAHASRKIAFGRATWPHMLVRAMFVEQIYRALTILGRHPYHRE